MYLVENIISVEEIIKKSRFLGILIPCQDENEVIAHLRALHTQYADASHIVFAYRLKNRTGGFIYRFNDAGEPSGTAGKPIFQHLEGKNLINVLLVVIRYFGGIKLGAGGLTRAYSNVAKKVIENSKLKSYIEKSQHSLTIEYSQFQLVEYLLKKSDGFILEQNFAEQIHLMIEIPVQNVEELRQHFIF